jgi:hypothetical protein
MSGVSQIPGSTSNGSIKELSGVSASEVKPDHSKVQHFIGKSKQQAEEANDALSEAEGARGARTSELTFPISARAGGNSLENAAPSSVADFVRERGGHTVITKGKQLH